MKILNIAPWAVYPPKYGGPTRIHNINLELSKLGHKIQLFSQGLANHEKKISNFKSWNTTINENYKIYRYVNPLELTFRAILHYSLKVPPIFSGDFLINNNKLNTYVKDAEIIKIEKPWQFKYIYENNKDTPLVLDSHDIEYLRVKSILKNSFVSKKILDIVKKKEEFAMKNSDAIFVVSEEESLKLQNIYSIPNSKIYVAPNGVDIENITPVTSEKKELLKKKYGFEKNKIILFIGSDYYPNIEAVENIIKFSKKLENKDALILVVGSCGNSFINKTFKNIKFTGIVENIYDYLAIADIAINPIISGGGSNIKLFEYMAAGTPIVTTKFGARGTDLIDFEDAIICNMDEFSEKIELLLNNKDLQLKIGNNARRSAVEKYSWSSVANKIDFVIKSLV